MAGASSDSGPNYARGTAVIHKMEFNSKDQEDMIAYDKCINVHRLYDCLYELAHMFTDKKSITEEQFKEVMKKNELKLSWPPGRTKFN